jgi:hypothetical protein
MAIDWEPDERAEIEQGIAKYPPESKRCAALARLVHPKARRRDEQTRGLQIRPLHAPWIVLDRDAPRIWASHTLIETQGHNVDALTGADGCASERYLGSHFLFPDKIQVEEVDVFSIDTWIEAETA